MFIVSRSVVAFAVFKLHPRLVQLDRDVSISTVARRGGAVITQPVIRGCIVLYALVNLAEVVGVEIDAASGVSGQSNECFLTGEVGVERIGHRLAGVR